MKNNKLSWESVLAYVVMVVIVMGLLVDLRLGGNATSPIDDIDSNKEQILSADDIGLYKVMKEEILSANYKSNNPNHTRDCDDFSEVIFLLESLENATFVLTKEPEGAMWMIEMVHVQTECGKYTVGVMDGVFVVSVDGDYNYYECSEQTAFLRRLSEIQRKYC